MSTNVAPATPIPGPPYFLAVPQPPTTGQRLAGWFSRLVLLLSILLNLYLLFLVSMLTNTATPIAEKHVAGNRLAKDKVAVVRVTGVIAEGLIEHALKQLEQAAEDDGVKIVVLAVNSPGGTVTASDLLYRH